MLDKYLPLLGVPFSITDAHVYLKRYGDGDPFVGGGKAMRISGDIDTDNGSPSTSTRLNINGGIELDQMREGAPGSTNFVLEMKDTQGNVFKSLLGNCWWIIDKRTHCKGRNRDAWNEWVDIERMCPSKASGRTVSGTDWENPEAESMVGFPMTALNTVTLRRLTGTEKLISPLVCFFTDIDATQLTPCENYNCSDVDNCIVHAVTSNVVAGHPWLFTSLAGGDLDSWTGLELAEWVDDATFVLALGNFVLIGSDVEDAILYSDDLGITRTEIDSVDYPDFALGAPHDADAIDTTCIIMCGAAGYIYKSVDTARTWKTVSGGDITWNNLNSVMIARDSPNIVYVCDATNTLLKSIDGGDNWFLLTGPAGIFDELLRVHVISRNHLLIWDYNGKLWESTDGGESWTEQITLPGVADSLLYADFASCACGDIVTVTAGIIDYDVYRSVYNGASGYWYTRLGTKWNGANVLARGVKGVTCCGPNRYIMTSGWRAGPYTLRIFLLTE